MSEPDWSKALREGILCDDVCKVRNAESGCDCAHVADYIDRLRTRVAELEARVIKEVGHIGLMAEDAMKARNRVAELVALHIQVVHCGGQCSAELLAKIERATQEEAGWTDPAKPR